MVLEQILQWSVEETLPEQMSTLQLTEDPTSEQLDTS